MELEFQLTKGDYKEYSRYTNQRIIGANKYFVWGRYGLYLFLFILLVYFDDQRYQYGVIGVGLGFIFYLYYNHLWFRHYEMSEWIILAPQKIICTAKGLEIKIPKAKSVLEWEYYFDFEETENLFLLFIESNLANMIPKRIFKDENQMKEFRKLCQDKILAKN